MRVKYLSFAAGALLVIVAGLAYAAYLEGDVPKAEPGIIRPPPPRPLPANPLTDMVGQLTVRDGYSYRGLTVFLVELQRVSDASAYMSTQEALAKGALVVREKEAGNVPSLIVENKGDERVLMIGGEVLLGGKQNRILREDVLLPPKSGPVEVAVRCIERGRWSGRVESFGESKSVAPMSVRGLTMSGASQGDVWDSVDASSALIGVRSSTQDLQATQDSPEVQKGLKEYRDDFSEHCWRPEAMGMVVARYGRIVGADVFCNSAVFRKHRDRLLESYAMDCITYRGSDEARRIAPPTPGPGVAEEFLRRVYRADFSWRGSPGEGRTLAATGAGLNATALVYQDHVVHACLMSEQDVIIIRPPEPIPLPRPMPMPRE